LNLTLLSVYHLQNGSTPFHWAAANCHLDVAQELLAAGANIDTPDNVRLNDYQSLLRQVISY
jgi:ankyrin repeat protein